MNMCSMPPLLNSPTSATDLAFCWLQLIEHFPGKCWVLDFSLQTCLSHVPSTCSARPQEPRALLITLPWAASLMHEPLATAPWAVGLPRHCSQVTSPRLRQAR